MLRQGALALRVLAPGGAGMQEGIEALYERWQAAEPEIAWKIVRSEQWAEMPNEECFRSLSSALLEQEADLVIYHLSEGPFVHHPALELAAVTEADNIMDFLCVRKGESNETFSETLERIRRIGHISPRREVQMRRLAPALEAVDAPRGFRKRLQKLKEGVFDAMLVSAMELPPDFNAGEEGLCFLPLSPDNVLPAVGQGSYGFLSRLTDPELIRKVRLLFNHEETARSYAAEREILLRLGQNNSRLMSARAEFKDGRLSVRAVNAAGGDVFFKQASDILSYDGDFRVDPERLAAYCDRLLGQVTFLGGGPNDSELLTYAAIQRIKEANVLVMDSDVGDHIYRWIHCGAAVIYIDAEDEAILLDDRTPVTLRRDLRKRISRQLLTLAREGKDIVRIYGDDDLAVGAFEEESSVLREAQVPYNYLPSLASSRKQRIAHAYRPLRGRKFILTRSNPCYEDPAVGGFRTFLRSLGAQVVDLPLYEAVTDPKTEYETDRTVSRFMAHLRRKPSSQDAAIIPASQRDVKTFFESLKRLEIDLRSLLDVRFQVPSRSVADCLLEHGIQADFVSCCGFSELADYCREELSPDSYVLWSHMQPLAKGTFSDFAENDGDGTLPPRIRNFNETLRATGAEVLTVNPYRLERRIYCAHRRRHVLGSTTDVVLFSPLEVAYLLDLLNMSALTSPERFFAEHHVYATSPIIARLLRQRGCSKAVEINLADREMLYPACTEIKAIEDAIEKSLAR